MEAELKPCPFCGSKRINVIIDTHDYYLIGCHDCHTEGPQANTVHEAIAKWNERTDNKGVEA